MNAKKDHISSTMTDPVTGLADESLFTIYMDEVNHRGMMWEYSSIFFGVTGLDSVVKQYGIQERNKILGQYAGYLRKFANDDEFLCSLGGDIFVALIKTDRTNSFLNHIEAVNIETVKNGEILKHQVGAVAGIWHIKGTIRDIRDVIGNASIAYIQAKYVLHEFYIVIEEGEVARATQKWDAVETFRDALRKNEFGIYYQPKVDSDTNTVVGAEGLVRWFHNGEMVSPGVFIRPMEQTGEILQLDYYVLRKICEDIKEWKKLGLGIVPISVNCSRKNLFDEDLAGNINYIIEKAGIDKSLIEVEVKEPVNLEEHGIMSQFLSQLSSLGVTTAIDDFGSGFSSLATMRDFRLNTLKIPRTFISTGDFSQRDEVVLTHILQMAKELDIQVLMQGVEREDQLAFVRHIGYRLIQGYIYDRPLSKEEFEQRLVNKVYKKEDTETPLK